MAAARRIVLTTFGSLGDLHPYIAIAMGLRERGHRPVLATSEKYRQKIEALGIGFHAIRPDLPDFETKPQLIARLMDRRKGTERVVREMVMPFVEQSYDDLLAGIDGADLLVSHPLTYFARLAAEKAALPWASTALAPMQFFSAYDPPVLPGLEFLARYKSPAIHRALHKLARWITQRWAKPWHQLRKKIGLPAVSENPIFEGQYSPSLVMGLFSRAMAAPQPDWPANTIVTGFAFYDQHGEPDLPAALLRFLEHGPAPIVFTLGSSAVMAAGDYFQQSAAAAARLGRRAVLLTGTDARNQRAAWPAGVAAFDYAPFSQLFPRAAAVVHQGGIGTCGQAMRGGKPMLVVPYAHDQPDNATRLVRLGIARMIPRGSYTAAHATQQLDALLSDESCAARARQVAWEVRREDGVATACDAIERLMRGTSSVAGRKVATAEPGTKDA